MEDHENEELRSTCCGASKHGDSEYCSACYEWAEFVPFNEWLLNRMDPAVYAYAPTQTQITRWIARVALGRI